VCILVFLCREREARKQAKADAEADAAWRLLLRGLLARVRLQQDYGGAQMGAEADAAAALLQHGSPTGAVAGRKRGRGGAKTTARAAAKDEVIDLASSDSDGGPAAAAAAAVVPVRKGDTRGLRSKLQAAVSAGRQQRQQLDEKEQEEQPAHMAGVKEEEI
jgi:xeroderma pigmentosum group C-complementing protein